MTLFKPVRANRPSVFIYACTYMRVYVDVKIKLLYYLFKINAIELSQYDI